MQTPFYDHTVSYLDNYDKGPFGLFATNPEEALPKPKPTTFLGFSVDVPFGIPAGPLLNSKFVNAAWNWGYSIPVYKTVRGNEYPTHPAPNVIKVTSKQKDIHPGETVIGHPDQSSVDVTRDGITNSFGVPSKVPEIWQADVKKSLAVMKPGNVMVLSFMGTKKEDMTFDEYVADFEKACKLAKDTGAPILEVNFSCPNVGKEGLICNDVPTSRAILEALKKAKGNTPLLVKIGYFDKSQQDTLTKLLDAIYENVEGVSAINTIQAKVVDESGNQALPGSPVRLMSGICGAAIKWAGLEMAEKLVAYKKGKALKDFAVVGVGGVTTVEDYHQYMSLGVDAVQSATGAMWRPELAIEVRKSLV